ncbi:MAG: DNA polymerase III subunit beta [Armatimonadota bacterium]|nr:DNA polymerase III subunit beta [Armatimonadota bacterium]
MKVTCARRDLFEGVQTVGRIVSGRSTLPILTHILIQTGEDHLRLLSTDFEVGMELTVPAAVSTGGAVTVPARVLQDLLSSLPDSSVELSVDENNVMHIGCVRSHYALRGLPAEDFPALPGVQGGRAVELEQRVLKRVINETLFAVSVDETRALLTGALTILANGVIKMVTTDTHRLAVSVMPVEGLRIEDSDGDEGVIIPARALRELARVLSDEPGNMVQVELTRNQAAFRMEGLVLVSRLIDGQFPNFERVIPKEHQKRLVLNTEEFLAALRRACSILPRGGSNRVVFQTETEGFLDIRSEAGEVGSAHEQVEVVREGDPIEIAFNGNYLIDMLSITEAESVVLELGGAVSPAVIHPLPTDDTPEGRLYQYVVMPMAIQ